MALEHRKGQIIDRMVHERTGKVAEIRLDKRSLWFWCKIGDDYHESKNGDEVKEWARKIIALSDDVTWLPVLEITASHDEFRYGRRRRGEIVGDCEVKLAVDRYYIGRTPTGKWWRTSWESCDEDSNKYIDQYERVKQAEAFDVAKQYEDPQSYQNRGRRHAPGQFKLPYQGGGSTVYLPYDETAYQGAVTILAQLRTTAEALQSLLASKKATATLQAVAGGGSFLLTSGTKKATARVATDD